TRIRSTKAIGDDAETEAARYLMRQGHKIIDRNWRTKFCEIDIVSKLGDVIYFTEVKYRKKPDQGGGLAAITTKKLRQMKFAAEYYAAINQSIDTKLRLAAISLTGVQPTVEVFLEIK
ncbi:MAG TPA: YraN family protein, partial [Candidatus Saccharibacteria bacterium]|nr:YraN family protein [Candidatus Saccharibacteria bacterium]